MSSGSSRRPTGMRFRTTILTAGKTATGIEVPPEVVEALGASKRPPVRVTINGYTYRNTIAVMGGKYMVGVSAEHRAGAGVDGGDEVNVDIELDDEPRTVEIPPELAKALAKDKTAKARFDALAFTHRKEYAQWVAEAKRAETRDRRVRDTLERLKAGWKRG